MGLMTISPRKYGLLLADSLPKVIETAAELERFSEKLESLDRLKRDLTPEERVLESLLARLIEDYEDRIELPPLPPHKLVAFLMERRGLKQVELLPVFGSRSIASDVLAGKRDLSKTHIRKLATFFRLSPAPFF
jgi:HTH-type transcriptional regulator/antitoxin HigA